LRGTRVLRENVDACSERNVADGHLAADGAVHHFVQRSVAPDGDHRVKALLAGRFE
jgi:hypothetical protein